MLVQSFFVEIVNLMRLSPEFIANDAFASYTFLEDARFALAFPIHKALMAMNDRRATQFLAPFWEKLESPGLPSGQFAAVTVILGAEADSFYFSELDLAILTSLYGRPISDRPIEVKFESSYRLFELPVPSPTTSPPKDDPPDEEFRRGQLHRTFDLGDVDPFECLPDSPESRALIDREILWYRTSLASLRARLKTYAQLDADAVTVDSLVNCLYFLYVERFPILPGTSNRLQGAVREIRRAFKARALGLAGLDLVGLASASQLRDLAREFSDDIPADRETFVKNLAAKVSAIGKIPSTPLFQRYNRLRETYAEFEAVAFLQTLSGLRVEIDELPGMKGRFGASAPTPPPAEFRVARQMLADCLARRKVASDQGNGARRLRGHEAVAAAQISAQLSGGGDGPRALHLIVDSFEVPQREEIGVFFQEVLAVRTKCGARFGVDFDPEFVANLDALVQWMNAITNV
jgi:hypothetical protein